MKKLFLSLFLLASFYAGNASAVAVVDVVDSPSYFFAGPGQETDAPYYRWYDEDWSWQHNALASSYATAELKISAWDVDYDQGERDIISIYNVDTNLWEDLGALAGANDVFAFTTFDISAYASSIADGLQVRIDIDSTNTRDFWAVSLAKSVITLDGAIGPGPNPSAVPEPSTWLLMGLGLIGLVTLRKRAKV